MKSLIVFGTMFAVPLASLAQIADPHVLTSSGSEGVNTDLKMEWTMGEFGAGVGGNNHYHFTAGFHQPDPLPEGVGLIEHAPAHGDLHIWPNPAEHQVHFRFSAPSNTSMDVTVFDERGAAVLSSTLGRGITEGTLQVSKLVAGTYVALFSSQGTKARTVVRFTIVR